MILAGYEFMNEKPFTNVYLTGIVRDKQGRKMSKSLGNSPDPLELITKYSADGVRVGMLLASPAGNDLLFDESLCEQGRNFANKIWNAFRLIKGWTTSDQKQSNSDKISIAWFRARFNEQLDIINDHYSKYRMNDALMASYKLIWDDFCSWYLEMIKPEFIDGTAVPVCKETLKQTVEFFEDILKVIHPWMPFISEELWHLLNDRKPNECLIVTSWPTYTVPDKKLLSGFEIASEIVQQIRNTRKQKNISPKEALPLFVKKDSAFDTRFNDTIVRLSNLSRFENTEEKPLNALSLLVKQYEFYLPLSGAIDAGAEKDRLRKELEYNQGFLKSVQAKLANERFVSNAKPEILENEKKKQADAESKIKSIEKQIESLN